eukprot:TRINITY_DN16978_c0_g1_i1.p1 TRINITY_DN16978_c0_g1~~TRINITY_DN16978_c0_g1_i1.p1  ORF type:complete len:415 (+),score=91.13 TRINITY_DN16978_c0_g1_i1:69-1313(+)
MLAACLLAACVAAAAPAPREATGYLPGSVPGVRLFYWLYEAPPGGRGRPLVVWLQGGPGASSLFGAFAENGPYRIDPATLTPTRNNASWYEHADLLYVDNPAGTGFSVGRLATDGATLAADMTAALQGFFKQRPELRERDLYITGESFAGHMIPQIAVAMVEACPNDPSCRFNLKGVAMGDGWTNPIIQNGVWGEVAASFGLVSPAQHRAIDAQYAECRAAIERGEFLASLKVCYSSLLGVVTEAAGGVNVYDVRMGSTAHDFSHLGRYLNRPDVKAAIGVPRNLTWRMAAPAVEPALDGEYSRDVTPLVAALLDKHGVRVLVYSGQFDLICAALGTDRWVDAMAWTGQPAYRADTRSAWHGADGVLAGYVQAARGLTRVVVGGAGHYVPHDQPAHSAEMVRRFLLEDSVESVR